MDAARSSAVGFSIGTKGYIGTGIRGGGDGWEGNYYHLKDFWEWDQATNVWTRKADLEGSGRSNAVGFSIGTKGYIGTGIGWVEEGWMVTISWISGNGIRQLMYGQGKQTLEDQADPELLVFQ